MVNAGNDAGCAPERPGGALELYARLRLHARPERMLDLFHLGHEIGDFDQFVLGVAAGDDDVLVRAACRAGRSSTSSSGR